MGRHRGKIKSVTEGNQQVVRFWHPLKKKIVRIGLGRGDAADQALEILNRVLQDPEHRVPDGAPDCIAVAFDVSSVPAVDPNDATVPMEVHQEALDRIKLLEETLARVRNEKKHAERMLGRKVRSGPSPTLKQAQTDFKKHYGGRDKWHTANVMAEIARFCKKFDEETLVDDLDGKEREIESYISNMDAGASRKHWIRTYVLKFLKHAGLHIDREQVAPISSRDIKRDRGGIVWLQKDEAEQLTKKLPAYWADMWRVQVGIGLRPTELVTLRRQNFSNDFAELTLAAIEEFGLKTGSRKIVVPNGVREIVRRRLRRKKDSIVFTNPETGEAWNRRRWFYRCYKRALVAAAEKAKIAAAVDSRTGRRTCASLLLRSSRADGARYSVEDVAAILGDRAETIREHYGRIISGEVDPTPAGI